MYAVMRNIYGSFTTETSGVSLEKASEICGRIIRESHGGEAHVVSAAVAAEMEGADCATAEFLAFDQDGDLC